MATMQYNFKFIDSSKYHQDFDSSARLHYKTLDHMKGLVPHLVDPSILLLKDWTKNTGEKIYFPFFIREPFSLENFDFISILDDKTKSLMKQNRIIPIIFMVSECWQIFAVTKHKSPYGKIIRHFEKHGIGEKNLVWMVCDKYISPPNWAKCKFIHFDFFLEQQKRLQKQFFPLENIMHKFASLAMGVSRHHRYAMSYSLYAHDLIKHGIASCPEFRDFKYVSGRLTTKQYMEKLNCYDQELFENFKRDLPMIFDDKINLHQDAQDESHLFNETFLNLVNETHNPDDLTFVTEKTYRTISHCRPFIVNGDNHTLRYLHELGFKTFDKFWDESYDHATSDFDKIDKITKIVMSLCDKSSTELLDMFEDMIPVLEHNLNILNTFQQWHKLN